MSADVQAAHNPELFRTRSVARPLTSKEIMQRAAAVCVARPSPRSLPCSGQLFVGMFFDGTGNNENADYLSVRGKVADHKHSNVVRLYHAYPDDEVKGTNKYYRYYVPGVGTAFPEIDDSGGPAGTAASWNGEPRLIWGITRVFNAISQYVGDRDLIADAQAGRIANATGGLFSMAMHRNHVFKTYWAGELKKLVDARPKNKPKPEQINLSVYGFSRGAAEARAFVNWLYALCDERDGGYVFCNVPMRIEFMGIFDTVASVGMAGAFSSGLLGVEGHQSWASENMQIHKGVESCLHLVAAHEVRSTFPLDSVRVEGRYPDNTKEYVYPGAHSDVGGGYHPKAYGKTDQLARIPAFEMYCAALAAGVPLTSYKELKTDVANALTPSQAALDIFNAYMKSAAVSPGPVEDMMRQHMARYFNYRYQAREGVDSADGVTYLRRPFFQRAQEKEFLRDTQQHFIAILANAATKMDSIMAAESSYDDYLPHPFVGVSAALTRPYALHDKLLGMPDKTAGGICTRLVAWKKWLADHNSPVLMDEGAPERDLLSLLETLTDKALDKDTQAFFDDWVHDSMAGLARDKVNEFILNGIGLSKFRRVYFGDKGDRMTRDAAARVNRERTSATDAARRQRRQWDLEAREFARTR